MIQKHRTARFIALTGILALLPLAAILPAHAQSISINGAAFAIERATFDAQRAHFGSDASDF